MKSLDSWEMCLFTFLQREVEKIDTNMQECEPIAD